MTKNNIISKKNKCLVAICSFSINNFHLLRTLFCISNIAILDSNTNTLFYAACLIILYLIKYKCFKCFKNVLNVFVEINHFHYTIDVKGKINCHYSFSSSIRIKNSIIKRLSL